MNILEKILEKKREETEAAKRAISYAEIFESAKNSKAAPSFASALKLKRGMPAIIAELKKASPSMGLIRENFDVKSLAEGFERAGAAALSVLTEKNFFLGSPENLKIAKASVNIPILRKDFIFEPYQLCEAKAWGASAALLIAAMLEKSALKDLVDFADSIGLETLVETHSETELECALECGAKIVGVNCRNHKTFKFDFSLFAKLISQIPDGRIAVAESGMESRDALAAAANAGADAALVGTALMNKPNPEAELKKLLQGHEN